jgi:YD repeat-containing protein
VTGESTVGLKFRIQEVADSAPDAALLLSRVFFTDVPLPAHLPDPCATPGPSNPDRNGNCIVDNVTNPLPSDLSRTAGSFRYSQTLLDVPGKLLPFELTITYSSDRTREDQLGPKWSHNFDSTLEESPDFSGNTCPDSVYVWTGGGNVEVYKETDATINVPPVVRCEYEPLYPGIYSKLTADPCCGVAYRYDTKDNFFSDFNPETPGSTKHRRDFSAHPNAQAIFITYDPATGQVDYVTDSRGEQYNFIYDDGFTPARLVSVSGPGAEISFGYDGLGFLSTVTDPNGLTTTFTYDGDGKILTVTDADGNRIVTNEYESAGGLGVDQSGDRIVRQENANPGDPGLTKAYTGDSVGTQGRTDGRSKERYDVFGRVVQRLVLLDSTPPNSLDACDVAVPANTPWCAVTKLAYNEQNLVAEEIDPRGVVTQFEYNAKGDVTCRTEDALGTPYRTGFNHDGRNNVVARLVQRDAAVLPLCPPPTSVSQAAPLANLAPGEAAKWLVTLVQYNVVPLPYDLLTGRVDPLGRLTTFTRYPQAAPGSTEPLRGLLQAVTNAVGATLGFTYDSLGHPRTETGPLGEVTQYTYDLLGQRTSRTDPRGNTWLTSYDAGGRLVFQADPLFNLETYTYDARGNVLTRTDPADAVWQSTYTPTGQDETTADPLGNAVAFEYDAEDRLTVVTNPRGFETRRSYDAAGRLASLTDAQGNVSTFEHDRAGNLTAMTNALGRRTEFDYDARGRVLRHRVCKSGGERRAAYTPG